MKTYRKPNEQLFSQWMATQLPKRKDAKALTLKYLYIFWYIYFIIILDVFDSVHVFVFRI